jgi:hypothetical protein
MSGVDITQIDAIGVETVEVVLSEYGSDLNCFPTEKQFVFAAAYENRCRQHRIGRLAATAKQLGYQLTPVST